MEEIGLRAIFESDEFSNGVKVYLAGIALADKATGGFASTVLDKMSQAVSKAAPYIQVLSSFFQRMPSEANNAASATNVFAGAVESAGGVVEKLSFGSLALAETVGNILTNAIMKAVSAVKDFISEGILGAARAQEMDFVLENLGKQFGYSTGQINEQVKAVKEYGIQTDVAQNLTSQFIRYQLDLSKAGDLARVAQDTAVVSMASSSETLQRLLYGIQTYNTEVLRTAGLNVSMQTAFDNFAKTLGKTTEQLSQTEKQQAVLNAILEEGARNAGIYEAAMEAPGKQLRSFERDMYELTLVMGEPFLEAFGEFVGMLRDTAKAFRAAIDEGGALHPLFVTLGGAASAIASILREAVGVLTGFITVEKQASETTDGFTGSLQKIPDAVAPIQTVFDDLLNWFDNTFGGLIDSALEWGTGFIGAFAQGIIDGIGAIFDAIAYMANGIAAWLQPHSPPKFLPDLDKWGARAMEEYLKGWSKADFSIFKGLASEVSSIMKSVAGKDDKGLIPSILGSREAIAQSINEVNKLGEVTASAINRIVAAAGIGSDAFREYVTASLESEVAAQKVVAAQEQLNQVTAFYDAELQKLNETLASGTQKLNEDQRLKAIDAALANKNLTADERARLEAEKSDILTKRRITDLQKERAVAIDAAKSKVTAAQDEYDSIQQRMELAKMTLDLTTEQNTLIKQQIDLLERLAKAAEKSAKGGGKVSGGVGLPVLPEIGAQAGGGLDNVESPVEKVKNAIIQSLEDLWTRLQEGVSGFFTAIGTQIAESGIGQAFINLWASISETSSEIWTVITETWDSIYAYFQEWWAKYGEDVTTVWNAFVATITGIVTFFWDWIQLFWTERGDAIMEVINNFLTGITTVWALAWDAAQIYLEGVLTFIGEVIGAFAALISGDWDDFILHVQTAWQTAWDTVNQIIADVILIITTIVTTWVENFITLLSDTWETIITGASTAWEGVKKTISDIWNGIILAVTNALTGEGGVVTTIMSTMDGIITSLGEYISDFKDIGGNIIMGLVDGVVANAKAFIDSVLGAIQGAIDAVKFALQEESPSKVFANIGENMIAGMNIGITSSGDGLNKTLVNTVGNAVNMVGGNTTVNNNSYQLAMSPQYSNYQSESSVYYDARAALAALTL